MKSTILAGVAGLSIGLTFAAFAEPVHDWAELDAIHGRILQEITEMEKISKANHYDMGGHAAKAEQLLRQTEQELHLAVESAKAAH